MRQRPGADDGRPSGGAPPGTPEEAPAGGSAQGGHGGAAEGSRGGQGRAGPAPEPPLAAPIAAGSGIPELTPGEVHVWEARLAVPPSRLERLQRSLAPAERARADRLMDRTAAEHFIAGRGLLRELLAGYLDAEAHQIRLTHEASGKPCLEPASPIRFNVSHAGGRALYAFSRTGPVGIDLEEIRELRQMDRVAARVMPPSLLVRWGELSPAERQAAFFREWTRLEAVGKLLGIGVWRLLQLGREYAPRAAALHTIPYDPAGFIAALATDWPDPQVRRLRVPTAD